MAFATAPSTPERAPGTPFIRRAFTAPIKLARQAIPSSEPEAQGAETLFAHNTARIVSFTTSTGIGRRHSSVTDSQYEFGTEEPAGTLPWASLTERTIAAGSLTRLLGLYLIKPCVQVPYESTVFLARWPSSTQARHCTPSLRNHSAGVWMAYPNLCYV